MNSNMNEDENMDEISFDFNVSNPSLLDEFKQLWDEAAEICDANSNQPSFEGYVSADYRAVYESLVILQGHACTFLEWGSGLGVVSIMASRMGFEAYGIESQSELVEYARLLSLAYQSNAKFAAGNFMPDDFEWNPAKGHEVSRSVIDVGAGYAELDKELPDFDLIYAYPRPEEHGLFESIIKDHGRPGSLLLSYDAKEGINLVRIKPDP